MNFSDRVNSSFIIILICSTIITIAGICGFQRLEPFINTLNSCNTQSLHYAEEMLSSISTRKNLNKFEKYLTKAQNNITEDGEEEVLNRIANDYRPAFNGNKKAEEKTIDDIIELSKINRNALERAGLKAKKMESVGIWIIIFPSIFIWIIGLTILKKLRRTFIKPLQELNSVVSDYNKGNLMRRCPTYTPLKDLQKLYDGINRILDNK